MRIEEDLKLDYSDVLFRPKRSTLSSRKDVDLNRTYKFKYSKNEWSGIPIMAANMDGVGELGIAENLSEYGMITCLTKQHDFQKIKKESIGPGIAPHEFCIKYNLSAKLSSLQIAAPIITSECPPIYLVRECITISAPKSNGLCK